MGRDQYAYAGIGDDKEEIAYWRKHNRLHGWMQDLWMDKGKPNAPKEESPMGDFNCIPVRLTLSDLEQLEAHIVDKKLPETGGFFFGHDSFDWYDENGKCVCAQTREEVHAGSVARAQEGVPAVRHRGQPHLRAAGRALQRVHVIPDAAHPAAAERLQPISHRAIATLAQLAVAQLRWRRWLRGAEA